MFVDHVKVSLFAGKGGDGIIAWHRAKYIPKGGPSGGNGGTGGSVIFRSSPHEYSLSTFRNRRILKAENGQQGGGNCRHGKNGKDLIITVPCGTLIKDTETGEILHDFVKEDETWIACHGGKGGRGNETFKTPTNRAPLICTLGKPGEALQVELELKLIADVGLVGLPNAGKSTLIGKLTKARVKIAPYPFTTLQPCLGYMECSDYTRIFLADLPGIIEGAHADRGLGIEFLKHIERTKLLVFVLDSSGSEGRTPLADFQTLQKELTAYNPELLQRPFIVVLNKMDEEGAEKHKKQFMKKFSYDASRVLSISALEGTGLKDLCSLIEELLHQSKNM